MATQSDDLSVKPKSATYNGSCHCGQVRFTMKLSPPIEEGTVSNCNCSICSINGLLMVYPLDKNIEWTNGFDDMTSYTFGKERVAHSFCSTCGTNMRAKSTDPKWFQDNTAINVRTIEGIDLEKLPYKKFDGKSL